MEGLSHGLRSDPDKRAARPPAADRQPVSEQVLALVTDWIVRPWGADATDGAGNDSESRVQQ